MSFELKAPQPLTVDHYCDDFSCGEPTLEDWLKRRALLNQMSGASRSGEPRIRPLRAGGECCFTSSGNREGPPQHARANTGNGLARLAVDRQAQGIRLGAAMLRDAVYRAVAVSEHAGVSALLVYAFHDRAKSFYQHFGFQTSPIKPLVLMLPLNRAKIG